MPKTVMWEHNLYSDDRMSGDEAQSWKHKPLVTCLSKFVTLFEDNKIVHTLTSVESFLLPPPLAHRGTKVLKVLSQATAKRQKAYVECLADVIVEKTTNLELDLCRAFLRKHRPAALENLPVSRVTPQE